MASQRILWIALPAGRIERGGTELLRLSVLAAPRLTPDPGREQLQFFPDWLNWTDVARSFDRFEIEVEGGPILEGRPAATAALDPILWPKLFAPELAVRPFEFADYADRTILSYPAADAMEDVKRGFQSLAFASPNALPSVQDFLDVLGPFAVDLRPDLAARARELQRAEQARNPLDLPDARPPREKLATQELVTRALLFHSSDATDPPELPRPGPRMRDLFDFHKALAQLGDYPALMRALGLVIDVEFPADTFAAFSSPSTLLRLCARPRRGLRGNVATTVVPLWTAFIWDGKMFAAAPRPAPVPEIVDGLLNLSGADYTLAELDIDGAVLKQATSALAVTQSSGRRAPDSPAGEAPGTLRSSGFALLRHERALRVHGTFGRAAARNAQLENGTPVAPLFAEDLVRGFVVDIWTSLTGAWHSLFRRIGDYRFLKDGTRLAIEDEGFSQIALTEKAAAPGEAPKGDVRLHEALWAWNGWSLAAPRPGKSILSGSGSEAEPEYVGNDAESSLPLAVTFRAAPYSLPRLRYGARYRMRARAVDLGGNVPPLATAREAAVVPSEGSQPYLRFEPLPAPTVLLREPLHTSAKLGESLERLVIRSRNDSPERDVVPTTERSERHVAPPRTSVQASEWHGMLDAAAGGVRGDPTTYEMLRDRDAADWPTDPQTGEPIDAAAAPEVPYLPDPLAHGAALRGVPGVAEGCVARLNGSGHLVQEQLPGALVRPGTATLVNFEHGPAWPSVRGFRIVLVEGDGPPRWESEERALVLSLPKAQVATVPLSCFLRKEDLQLFGVWGWLREIIEGRAAVKGRDPAAMLDLGVQTTHVAQFALEGALWAITPARMLRLVHAVQQPLRSAAASLSAVRADASLAVELVGEISLHGASTGSLDLHADWTEQVDVEDSGPTMRRLRDHADSIPVRELAHTMLRNGDRLVGEYFPDRDLILCRGHAHLRHELGDTKHRSVRYRLIGTSRFTDCFPPDAPGGFVRSGQEITVDIPASARPTPPALEYVVPTFGWERHTDTNLQASVRRGYGLRVYLRRPWYSSGDNERLGVVVRGAGRPPPSDIEREALKPFITQWGGDPIWGSAPLPALPTRSSFVGAVDGADAVALPELRGEHVAVAGHAVQFDVERKMWYCDIEIDSGATYFPFVRLALARYQPSALTQCHLSTVTLAAFAQIAPDRTLIVTHDPADADLFRVVVSGATYGSSRNLSIIGQHVSRTGSEITIEVQERVPGLEDEIAWKSSSAAIIAPADTERPDTLLWRGTVRMPTPRLQGAFRIVAREYETHEADSDGSVAANVQGARQAGIGLPLMPRVVRRLVYLDGIVI
jgi:hypothetical protein